MTAVRREGEILLEPPLVRDATVVPAVEDRSYVLFIAGALLSALAGGFALAVLLSLAGSGQFWVERVPWLTQAHGWAQLSGWGGLFVAGMGFRLLPRFSGRRPLPRMLTLAVFAFLFVGLAVRTIAQPFAGDGASASLVLAGSLLWAAGAATCAAVVLVTLLRGRGGNEPWRAFAFAGAAWWAAWAVLSVTAGFRALGEDAFVPLALDDPATWVVMLGAIGNFVWAVQSRSVPIFFGRKTPRFGRVAAPGISLNVGVALLFAAACIDAGETHERLMGAGFIAAGIAFVWLAPVAGSCWGRAKRLRARARSAARFVLFANLAAVVCGALLVAAGSRTVVDGGFAEPGLRDAARHSFGLGVMTMLIVGMAQLVAPFFAVKRLEGPHRRLIDETLFGLLAAAAILRVVAGLLWDEISVDSRMHLGAIAGSLAWLGLVLFAAMVVGAARAEPRLKAELAQAAAKGPAPKAGPPRTHQ